MTILSYDYPPNDGGISRLSSEVAHELARSGLQVLVLTLAAHRRQGSIRSSMSLVEVRGQGPRRDWETFLFVRALPAGSTIVCTVWNPEGSLAWLAGHRDTVIMAHGNELIPYPARLHYVLKRWLRRKVLASARVVVCNSHYTAQLVQTASPSARTVVITPGVDVARFAPQDKSVITRKKFDLPANKRIVLSVSRVDAYKGHDVVLRALAALPTSHGEKLHYVVAGKGSHVPALQALATNLGVADWVTWLGFVDDAELPSLYGCADLFVLCTRDDPTERGVEGFGMVFLEAQAAGVPVIGTRAGGIPDAVVEGKGGWLVKQDDVDGVRGHFERLVEDVAPFRAQGARGRERVCTEGSWKRYVTKLLSVLEDGRD